MLKRLLAVLAALGLVIGAAACGSDGSSADGGDRSRPRSEGDFKVLMVVALSGPTGALGEAQEQAFRASVAEVNKQGGIGGRKVVVEVVDDGGDPTKAVGLLRERLAKSRPDLVWPGTTGNEVRAMLPVLTRENVLAMDSAGDAKITAKEFPTYFVLYPRQSAPAEALVKYAQEKGVKTLGLLYGADAYGTSAFEASKAAAEKAGLRVVSESYQPTDLDFTGVLDRLRSKAPDLLWVEAIGAPGPIILNNRAKMQWDVPVVGDLTLASQPLTTLVDPGALEGVTLQAYRVQRYVAPEERSDALARMIDATKAGGKLVMPLHIYAFPYDALWLVKAAAEQAGSTETDDLVKALESLDTDADPAWVAFDRYQYSSSDHFVAPDDSHYVFIAPGPIEDGMIRSDEPAAAPDAG